MLRFQCRAFRSVEAQLPMWYLAVQPWLSITLKTLGIWAYRVVGRAREELHHSPASNWSCPAPHLGCTQSMQLRAYVIIMHTVFYLFYYIASWHGLVFVCLPDSLQYEPTTVPLSIGVYSMAFSGFFAETCTCPPGSQHAWQEP